MSTGASHARGDGNGGNAGEKVVHQAPSNCRSSVVTLKLKQDWHSTNSDCKCCQKPFRGTGHFTTVADNVNSADKKNERNKDRAKIERFKVSGEPKGIRHQHGARRSQTGRQRQQIVEPAISDCFPK